MIKIILGPVCSGKDHLANAMMQDGRILTHIDIGTIVREISQTKDRIHDKSFDQLIIDKLRILILNASSNIGITGIRQKTIIDWVLDTVGASCCEIFWLENSMEELKRRFEIRTQTRAESLSFEEIIKRDNELGLKEVEDYVKQLSVTKIMPYDIKGL